VKRFLCMICFIIFLSGCSIFNSRFLPNGQAVISATITVVEKDTDKNPENSILRPVLYLEKSDASRLFNILKNSMYSFEKLPSAEPVKYKVTFLGKDKVKLLTLDLKGESSALVIKPEGSKAGEYEVSNEFVREINTQIKNHDF